MLALTLTANGPELVRDAPIPIPETHEILVRVRLAGVCETDLQLIQGYMGFEGILGHEFVGVAQDGKYAGQRVVGEINCCAPPDLGLPISVRHHWPARTVMGIFQRDGAFAEYVVLPEENLHALPDHLSDEEAVFVEPLAAAFQILEQVSLSPRERVIVLGDGRLGYLIAQVLAETGAEVVVVGRHAEKLQRFDKFNVQTTLLEEIPSEWFNSRNADVVVDCTGNPQGIELALKLVRPLGTIVLKTTVAGEQTLALAPFVIDEIRLVGSRCGPFDKAISALAEGRIEVRSLITARFSIEAAEQALEKAQQKDQHKVLIEFPGVE